MTVEQRALGTTGITVGALALGLVKLGRTTALKYPTPAKIPSDDEAWQFLSAAHEVGINLLDTAPAYGNSEARLGALLKKEGGAKRGLSNKRDDWVICTKVGESFDGTRSTYDFSPAATRTSVEQSLQHLQTDYLDIVLIHSDGRDEEILQKFGTLETLKELRDAGKIRAVGISHKTPAGAAIAIKQEADVIMATLNPAYQDELAVIAAAQTAGVGVLVKKALASGHGKPQDLAWVSAQAGVASIVVGTTNPVHLLDNVALLNG